MEGLNIHVTTMDMVLAMALVITAGFAMEQLYRWWLQKEDKLELELEGSRDDAQPLLHV